MSSDPQAAAGHSSSVERRLATIMMADVFGYSRMMGENEERTVQTLRGHRVVFDELLAAHKGRIFNTAGDAILAEFPSAVEAVRCATEIQTALRTRNEHLPEGERMWFRIGINLGDVIVQGGDLLGDGVNVAARIQSIAEPGGVCIAGSVYDQIQNKLTLQIKPLGEKSFKNIAQPVRTFSISDEAGGAPHGVRWRAPRKGPLAAAVATVAAFAAISGAGYWLYRDYQVRAAEETRRADETRHAAELQQRAEQTQAAQATAEREAKLRAELQSAKDALAQAEASKRKAEIDRAAAEVARREAKVQADMKAAKEALQRAADSEKKAEEERLAAASAMKTAEAAAGQPRGSGRQSAAGMVAAAPSPKIGSGAKPSAQIAAEQKGPESTAKGIDRMDGTYLGRMCSTRPDGSPRCWPVGLNVAHGALSATWPTAFNNQPAHAKGTLGADGSVKLALDGYTQSGKALTAVVTGNLADDKLSISGNWNNGAPVTGTWVMRP